MDANSWFFGFSQNFAGGLAATIVVTLAVVVMAWIRSKGWTWGTPVVYALVTGETLFILLIGFLSQGEVPLNLWVPVGLLVFTLGTLWYTERRNQESQAAVGQSSPIEIDIEAMERSNALSLRQALSASTSTIVDTGPNLPAVVFVVEKTWVSRFPGENYPLKLRMRWANQGDDVHIGKPRWEPTRAYISDRQLMCRFKSLSKKYKTESEEIDVKRGEQGELWLALDPTLNTEQIERWREASQLGVLTLPVTVGTTMREVQIQL